MGNPLDATTKPTEKGVRMMPPTQSAIIWSVIYVLGVLCLALLVTTFLIYRQRRAIRNRRIRMAKMHLGDFRSIFSDALLEQYGKNLESELAKKSAFKNSDNVVKIEFGK